jgi:hypothetical protein
MTLPFQAIHPSLMSTAVEVRFDVIFPDAQGRPVFMSVTGKILSQDDTTLLFEHTAISGKPVVTEQINKQKIFSIRRTSSVLA